MKQLVLGGARSGKSHYAQQQAEKSAKKIIYVATAHAGDAEMQARIRQHKNSRPQDWQLIEEQVQLAQVLSEHDDENVCFLVDCLTLWLSNLLLHENKELFEQQRTKLLALLPELKADVLLVSNEVGQGIVPLGELNRRFVDEAGWLHQDIAAASDRVVWIMAGLPTILKGESSI